MSDNNNSGIRVNVHEEDEKYDVYSPQIYIMLSMPNVNYGYGYGYGNNHNPFSDLVFNPGSGMTPEQEIRSALTRVSMLDVMAGFFNDIIGGDSYGMQEDEMVRIAEQESLNHYKTQEKKPNVKLEIGSRVADDKTKEENCTICVSSIEEGEEITELECKHVLHTSCISEWVKYKSECPVCRHVVKTTNPDDNEHDEDLADLIASTPTTGGESGVIMQE